MIKNLYRFSSQKAQKRIGKRRWSRHKLNELYNSRNNDNSRAETSEQSQQSPHKRKQPQQSEKHSGEFTQQQKVVVVVIVGSGFGGGRIVIGTYRQREEAQIRGGEDQVEA